jgi:hypothetical protein
VLRRVVDERPAAYLDEIQRELREVYKIRIHISSICRYLHAPDREASGTASLCSSTGR